MPNRGLRLLRSRKRVAIIVRLVSAVGFFLAATIFWALSAAANDYPATPDHPGWIMLLQPDSDLGNTDHVMLQVRPMSPGSPGRHPLLEVTAVACGSEPLNVSLILSGDLRYVSRLRIGSQPTALKTATLLDEGSGTEASLAGATRVDFKGGALTPCVDSGGESFAGRLVLGIIVQSDAATAISDRHLGFKAIREAQSWPLIGTLPNFNLRSNGTFVGDGDFQGSWVRPFHLTFNLTLGSLRTSALVVTSSPPLAQTDDAHWNQATPLRAKLMILNQRDLARVQNWLALAAIAIGVSGSLIASLFLEIGAGSQKPAHDLDVPLESIQPAMGQLPSRQQWPWLAVFAIGVMIGALGRHMRRRR
jgi:hypothetical protein